MNTDLSKLSLNEKLAAFALLASLLAMVASLVFPGESHLIEVKKDTPTYVSVLQMAHWIKDREEIQLIDLRSKDVFDEFHVPTATHVSLIDLLDQNFDDTKKIILYAEKPTHETQAWLTLTGSGYSDVHILTGGAYDWHQRILYPKLPMSAGENTEPLINEIKTLSGFYGGRIEFIESDTVLNYYSQNKATREFIPKTNKVKLVRMGC